ncbi:glycosyltransferase family 2 protein [Chondrinema litorale]|uniref:glycosyltransferase family 2 protein n=1 Tax=Chondrinema litorale TaxID=2994555 RepID=UPI002543D30C|nr:glycosyltransferase [Chondrinema litorale]UZR93420.1 glycosyltransferase [Chondrinema litorale]
MLFFITVAIIYAFLTCWLAYLWQQIPRFRLDNQGVGIPLTVIVPARNESENISNLLNDLLDQTYKNFQIIVVDDNSEDNTYSIVEAFLSQFQNDFKLLRLEKDSNPSKGKKAAIYSGIQVATGEYIITTDADCRVEKDWLKALAQYISKTNAKLISAPVTFYKEKTLFEKIQTVEFMSLIGAGAAFMHIKKPNMCNGANICYQKQAFYEVGGFAGNEHLASGDDEFLMHKIASKYPNGVMFLKAKEAIVRTKALPDFKVFYNQRKRWGSKWSHYKKVSPKLVAITVFGFHFIFCTVLICWLLGIISIETLLTVFFTKLFSEILFIGSLLSFSQHRNKIFLIPLVAILHPFYIVLFGLAGNFGSYTWKDRKMN